MLLRLRVSNLREFSNVLNACSASVELTAPDGSVHVFPDDKAAADLCNLKPKNSARLPLTVRIHAPRDYFNIVSYYAGDC